MNFQLNLFLQHLPYNTWHMEIESYTTANAAMHFDILHCIIES